ncbi:DNA polymerase III subunit alpha [Williamsoniiplasma somnilux]|uniref:DNA-directed DNA polymerase n=1 Tax=Williamsoniiplasma somnilux TaxID=215578 RepID=A0A2K8NXR2_9MOLU|nr:DNA polymerase III subunit alpha [Williamsoniiplasma somnilux]ATZ18577.1 DNA polymerase III subunit alpha [Williamsoniiplasma somnilux]
MKFSPQINLRSCYNFQESLIKVPDYIDFAVRNNFKFAFYSELNSMYGVAEFVNLAKKNNIKPIIGLTLEFEHQIAILIAKNEQGYQNLTILSSWLMNENNHFNFDFQWTKFISDNLIMVTNSLTFKNSVKELIKTNDIYFNVVDLRKISYLEDKNYETFVILNAIKNNLTIAEVQNIGHEHYLSDEELLKLNVNLDINNKSLLEIANKCSFELFSNRQWNFAKFKTPQNMPSGNFLRKLCEESLNSYLLFAKNKKNPNVDYFERLNYELDVIYKTGFIDYFLVVWDYVKYARENQIMVGPGRGSAAGSLVSFLLKITTIDPLQYDLLFERFLNPKRVSLPDIDLDFQDDKRDLIIEYLFEKYGADKVATIVTFQSIGLKSAIRDVARVYEIDLKIVNEIAKLFPSFVVNQSFAEIINKSSKLRKYQEEYPEIFDHASALIGLPRQTGTHAAGVILSDVDIKNIVPIRIGYNGINQTQFDMKYLEPLGLIKMDVLGLRNLTTLQEILSSVYKSEKKLINLDEINLQDNETFVNLQAGKTSGIFQLESPGMTNVIMKIKTNSIEDISIASALFRPGPQEMIPEYVKRKFSNVPVEKYLIDKDLKSILEPTYGIIVYQEQVIQILRKVANFSLAQADLVRRAIGKKDFQKLHAAKNEFIEKATENNYQIQKAKMIWEWIEKFAAYGFNKSHSIAYSYISYWLAYLKTHYPAEFYCSLLNGVTGNVEKTSQYLKEINNYGIKIIKPSIKNINFNYIGFKTALIMPLTLIKGVGIEFIRKLREQYKSNPQIMDSVFSLVTLMFNHGLNKNVFEALVWSGALDCFGYSRSTLVENYEEILKFANFNKDIEIINNNLIPELTNYEDKEEILLNKEKEFIGFFISSHPIEKIRTEYSFLKAHKIINLLNKKGNFIIIGYVSAIKEKNDKHGDPMAFIEMSDETENIEITVFSRTFKNFKNDILLGSVLCVEINIDSFNDKPSFVLNKIIKIIKN